ncbi:MAG: heavy-metal-associated domain-containing protein [Halanaerobiaceae bacterium]|nr:heavy-metal-associated domain-containing protein [Halanaerobiaceae bacterium]
MKKTIQIEGMSCKHCEARVKKELEKIEGVERAEVSAEKKNAVLTLAKDIEEDLLRKAVEEAGYEYIRK